MSESKLLVEEKTIAVPGDVIAEGMEFLPSHGTYRKDDKIIAHTLGIVNVEGKVIKTIPLSGRYNPKRGDTIIGKVIDILMSGWRLDINCPYEAVLSMQEGSQDFIPRGADLRKYYDLNDFVVCKIVNVTSQKLVDVSTKGPGLRKIYGGTIFDINTNKVPRVIGKKGSMVSMLKNATDCKIVVGQNGKVWVCGEPANEKIAIDAINFIAQNSHRSGLTEQMKEFLEKQTGKKIEVQQEENTSEEE